MYILRRLSVILAAAFIAFPAVAQSQFDAVARVDERSITGYELAQRTLFLSLLQFPGDARSAALQQLINESIQKAAAARAGLEITAEGAQAGETEFAARAQLTREEFIAALAQQGVGPETFRDFAGMGILWRQFIQNRFRSQASNISDDDLERAIERSSAAGGTRVLISEIILPANSPETAAASRARAAEISRLTTVEDFAAAAQIYSIASSRNQGGEVEWRFLSALPPEIAGSIQRLGIGRVTQPIDLQNAIALYQLREIETIDADSARTVIDYAEFLIPTVSRDQVLRDLQVEVDQCDDLYGFARDLPGDRLIRESRSEAEIPAATRAALDGLDDNEAAILTRGEFVVYTMLCERQRGNAVSVDRAAVRNQLIGARLEGLAGAYLAELRAAAEIEIFIQ